MGKPAHFNICLQYLTECSAVAAQSSPYINSGKGDALAQKSRESPLPQSYKTEKQMRIWKVTGSTRLKHVAVRMVTSSARLVGIRNRVGMKFASKFDGTLVVKTQLGKLVKGMLSIAGPTNTQKDGM
eukprot:1162138-Pelagomonas_calceolata.AAC.6